MRYRNKSTKTVAVPIVPGSEIGANHLFMKYKLIKTLKTMTGLDIDINKIDADNPQQIEEVLTQAKDWAKKHDLKLLDE